MLPEEFWDRTWATLDGCRVWLGGKTQKGYGVYKGRRAHIVAYEAYMGPVPPGLELDHTCRNRACVAPAHLEPVTHLVNVRRGNAGKWLAAKTHCPQGHPYGGDNLYTSPGPGRVYRACRICRKASKARRRAAK